MRLRYCRQCGLRSASSTTRALFERARRLEQRRDLDLVGDPVMAGEPQGGEQRVAGLGLGDEETHRMGTVDVLEDLGDRHHQPRGGGALGRERAEIDRDRLHALRARGWWRDARGAEPRRWARLRPSMSSAHGVVDLAGVEPEMRQGDRDAVRRDAGAHQDSVRRIASLPRLSDGAASSAARIGAGIGQGASRARR